MNQKLIDLIEQMPREAKSQISAALAKNASDEMGAQKGYVELAELAESLGAPAEFVAEVHEVAGDEREHTTKWLKWLAYFDPETKIAPDGALEDLAVLREQIGKD